MSIRKRILIATGSAFAVIVLLLYLASRAILVGSFSALERKYVHDNVERILHTLTGELAALAATNADWAVWDDTYAFMENADRAYIESNLVDSTFITLRLNVMLFVDPSGQLVYGKGFDLYAKQEVPIPDGLQEHLTRDGLLQPLETGSIVSGILVLPEAPMLVASASVLPSGGNGPARGVLVMGRYLDTPEVTRFAKLARVSMDIYRFDDPGAPPDLSVACTALTRVFPRPESIFSQPLSGNIVAGYTLVRDIYGRPALIVRVEQPRDIYHQGQISMLYLIFLFLASGLAFTSVSSWLTDRVLISRLVRLNAEVDAIGASGELSHRVHITGNDELSNLAVAINRMLGALEYSLLALQKSEEALKRRNEELSTLYEAATAIGSELESGAVLLTVARQMVKALHSSRCTISLWHRERSMLETLVDYDVTAVGRTEFPGLTSSLDDHPDLRRVIESGQPLVIARPPADGIADKEIASEGQEAFSKLVLPLIVHDQVTGLIELADIQEAREYTPEEIRLAESLAAHAAIAIENSRLYERAQQEIEERKRTEARLRESEQRFQDVARFTGDWIWETDVRGNYIYVNPVVEQVLGYTPEEVIGKHYAQFLAPQPGSTLASIQQLAQRDVCQMVRKDGGIAYFKSSVMPLEDGVGNLLGYRGLHRDVTIERQIEERIATVHLLGRELVLSRNEEEIAQAAIEAIRLLLAPRRGGIWLVDREGKSLVCHACYPGASDSSTRTLSLEDEQLPLVSVVKSGVPLYIPELNDQIYGICSVLCVPLSIKGRVIGVLEVESGQAGAFDRDAQRLLTSLADQAALAVENARLYEQMRAAHERLQVLSARLIEVQEAERRHIARELHDEIGQLLTGLKLLIEAGTLTHDVTRVHATLKEAQALVNELMNRVRNLSLGLRPMSLDDLGLVPALRWHFERYIAQTGVQVVFKHVGIEGRRFAPQVETTVYRVVQEALTNVARHANVDNVTVRLWADEETMEVQIEDLGSGFDPNAVLSGGTSGGLSGMYERVALLGGRLTIESRPGAGTRVTADIPLSGSSEVV